MAPAVVEPALIDAPEEERAAISIVDQFLEQAVDSERARPQLVGRDGKSIQLPSSVLNLLRATVHYLAKGQALTLVPIDKELTTQQAADLLNVSRPYLVKLLEQGEIPYTKTGTHRRIRFADVMAYKTHRDAQRAEALTELTRLNQEMGLYNH